MAQKMFTFNQNAIKTDAALTGNIILKSFDLKKKIEETLMASSCGIVVKAKES
jgi:hypothetical protein